MLAASSQVKPSHSHSPGVPRPDFFHLLPPLHLLLLSDAWCVPPPPASPRSTTPPSFSFRCTPPDPLLPSSPTGEPAPVRGEGGHVRGAEAARQRYETHTHTHTRIGRRRRMCVHVILFQTVDCMMMEGRWKQDSSPAARREAGRMGLQVQVERGCGQGCRGRAGQEKRTIQFP